MVDETTERFLSHLRKTHFAIIVVSILVAFAGFQVSATNSSKAKKQLSAILSVASASGAVGVFDRNDDSHILLRFELEDKNQSEQFRLSDASPSDDFYIVSNSHVAGGIHQDCSNSPWPTLRRFSRARTISLSNDMRLGVFEELWNNLGAILHITQNTFADEITLVLSVGAEPIKAKRASLIYSVGKPVLVPCVDGDVLRLYWTTGNIYQNHPYNLVAEIMRSVDLVHDHDSLSAKTLNWRGRLAESMEGVDHQPNPGVFTQYFPELADVTAMFKSASLTDIANLVEIAEKIEDNSVKFAGIEIPFRMLSFFGSLVILITQLYFFFHITAFNSISRGFLTKVDEYPWIALYPNTLARIATIATVSILPALVSVGLFIFYVEGLPAELSSIASFSTLGAVVEIIPAAATLATILVSGISGHFLVFSRRHAAG